MGSCITGRLMSIWTLSITVTLVAIIITSPAATTDHYPQHQHFGGVSHQKSSYAGDSVVPVQQHQHFQLGLEFDNSKAAFSYSGSLSQSVSVSSMDVGVVPDSIMRDVSIAHSRPSKGTIDLFSGPPIQMPSHLTPMDREARVLRYREKKKTRKFEKTIRYASRKAYAETRPRIKGRFAKRTDVEAEVDQMFSTTLITEVGYGIVPSF
ncbi:Zinc finger protein CONSTANS 2 [Spatholobus suberectus]|nr:Zinc finger protein CONSTANS 2 [Spatholobus suberectus]